MAKISTKYWNSLRAFEHEYIQNRVHIDGVASLKLRINTARKLYPNYTKIYGKGIIKLPDGSELLWSGDDTKTFHKFES